MSDPADLDRLIERIHRQLRAERGRADPEHAAIEQELRNIRGRPDRRSKLRFLLSVLVPIAMLFALVLLWPHR